MSAVGARRRATTHWLMMRWRESNLIRFFLLRIKYELQHDACSRHRVVVVDQSTTPNCIKLNSACTLFALIAARHALTIRVFAPPHRNFAALCII